MEILKFSIDPTKLKDLKQIIATDAPFPRGSGWRAKTIRGGKMTIYVNRIENLVIKAPACLIGDETPGITLPTVPLGNGWVLQPLCTFENRSEAYKELAEKIGPDPYLKFDFHIANVGRYNGVARLYDW